MRCLHAAEKHPPGTALGGHPPADLQTAARAALRDGPGVVRAWWFHARRYDEARTLYDEAAQADARSGEAPYRAGVCAAALGRLDEAVAAWERAVERDPAHARARRNLDEARAKIGDGQGASPLLAPLGRARALVEARDFAAARQEMDRLLGGGGGFAAALLVRAEASLGLRDGEAAVGDARAALAADPSLVEAYRLMGEALRTSGDVERAAYWLEVYAERARTMPGREKAAADAAAAAKQLRSGAEW